MLELSVSSFVLHYISQVVNVELEEVLSQGAYMLLYSRYSYDHLLKEANALFFFSRTYHNIRAFYLSLSGVLVVFPFELRLIT